MSGNLEVKGVGTLWEVEVERKGDGIPKVAGSRRKKNEIISQLYR